MCCRYLLASRWFSLWKRYVGYDRWDVSGVGDPNLFPGPIDNSCLLGGECGPAARRGLRGCAGLPGQRSLWGGKDCERAGC